MKKSEKRIGRPTSTVKNHYSFQNEKWHCKYCPREKIKTYGAKTGTSNLWKHLFDLHWNFLSDEEKNSNRGRREEFHQHRDSRLMNMGYDGGSPTPTHWNSSSPVSSLSSLSSVASDWSYAAAPSSVSGNPSGSHPSPVLSPYGSGMARSPQGGAPVGDFYHLSRPASVSEFCADWTSFRPSGYAASGLNLDSFVDPESFSNNVSGMSGTATDATAFGERNSVDCSRPITSGAYDQLPPNEYDSYWRGVFAWPAASGVSLPPTSLSNDESAMLESLLGGGGHSVSYGTDYRQLTSASPTRSSARNVTDDSNVDAMGEIDASAPRGEKRKRSNRNDEIGGEHLGYAEAHQFLDAVGSDGLDQAAISEAVCSYVTKKPRFLQLLLSPAALQYLRLLNPRVSSGISIDSLRFGERLLARRQQLTEVLRRQRSRRWAPFVFDAFVFPFAVDGVRHLTVELLFQDERGRRRRCALDWVPVADGETDTAGLAQRVVRVLRSFGLDGGQLLDFSCWNGGAGLSLDGLREAVCRMMDVRTSRKMLEGGWSHDASRMKDYLGTKTLEKEHCVDRIATELASCTSLLDELELSALSPGDRCGWPLEICSRHCRPAAAWLSAVGRWQRRVERGIARIRSDRKGQIYYVHDCDHHPVNLLQVLPLLDYLESLAKVASHLRQWLDELRQSDNTADDEREENVAAWDMNELAVCLDFIEANDDDYDHDDDDDDDHDDKCSDVTARSNAKTHDIPGVVSVGISVEEMRSLFGKWRYVLERGFQMTGNYFLLCDSLRQLSLGGAATSEYSDQIAEVVLRKTADVSEEKLTEIALLRTYAKFLDFK